ncbi:DUF1992 domain-containing protein [Nocardioides sp. AE5]|uniref:DnaJ family domain-containing protein n=1 Tax=Nocardioides sp. AE5 TaxID=2962573 RepID=UPI0028813817|nr:DUF1992 domain-containing protein [Nocardioides sp. AE5]MDT0203493.1 DUF1992 domain-containing protein [Nocardioides sp. AE5]
MPEKPERPGSEAGKAVAAARMQQQHLWVDLQVRQAMERGEFDNLPGAGKPIEGLGGDDDPDWWLKRLVEREKVSVLPPALALRTEDRELDARLDEENTETAVVKILEDFNRRIVEARRQLQGGPPVITPLREIDEELAAWRERRTARREAQAAAVRADAGSRQERRRWWPRRRK